MNIAPSFQSISTFHVVRAQESPYKAMLPVQQQYSPIPLQNIVSVPQSDQLAGYATNALKAIDATVQTDSLQDTLIASIIDITV